MEETSEKELFSDLFKKYYKAKPNKRPYNVSQLNKIANEITTAKTSTSKSRRDYYLLNTYDVVLLNGETSVIRKIKNQGDPQIYVIPEEDIYNRLKDIHIHCGHGSRDKMINIIHQSCFIPRPCIEFFLKSCKVCHTKKTKVVVKPITSSNFMTRGQVDLIDFQSIADGDFKWLLNYQDHATKYQCLRPLRSKRAGEVAEELLKIFLLFGAPSILQSDNGREFANSVVEELKIMWPQLCIVHGRSHRMDDNQDVENMLRAWTLDNKSTAWSIGCHYVQWHKNTALHREIGRSPFKAVFGTDPKLGLKSTNLPQNIILTITTEEELEALQNGIDPTQQQDINQHQAAEGVNEMEVAQGSSEVKNEFDPTEQRLVEEQMAIKTEDTDNYSGTDDAQIEFVTIKLENCAENNAEMCVVCQTNITDDVRCETCKMPAHQICTNSKTTCNFCNLQVTIKTEQEGQKRQAEPMIAVTKKRLSNIAIGDCVLVKVDNVDRSPGDPPNLTSVVTEIKNSVYQVATAGGIIKSWFNRFDLEKATTNIIDLSQVNTSKILSIREAVSLESSLKERGSVKCSCRPSKVQCKSNRCQCYKEKLQCNSRCHKSGSCVNI